MSFIRRYTQLSIMCLLLGCADDEGPSTFIKVFGGDEHDIGRGIAVAADGEYIITGSTYADVNGIKISDIWLLKVTEDGSERWSRTIGGGDWDHGNSVIQSSSGNSVLVGYTWSYGSGETDVILRVSNSSGYTQFQKYFGGDSSDRGYGVIELTQGGYLLAGSTRSYGSGGSDAWAIKTDNSGNQLWDLAYGGIGDDAAYDLVESSDSTYLVAGKGNDSGDGGDMMAAMFADDGSIIWSQTYSGSGDDVAWAAAKGSDGNFLLAGQTRQSNAGDSDIFLVGINNLGVERWRVITGNTGDDAAQGAIAISDGEYVVTGYTANAEGNADLMLMRIDSGGNTVWTNTFDSGMDDRGYDLAEATGGYVVTGVTNQTGEELDGDLWVIRTDNNGKSD
ncbi:hypothetical protein ACFL6E_00715 [Candidatus Neomarinimicrobiota bacterium]